MRSFLPNSRLWSDTSRRLGRCSAALSLFSVYSSVPTGPLGAHADAFGSLTKKHLHLLLSQPHFHFIISQHCPEFHTGHLEPDSHRKQYPNLHQHSHVSVCSIFIARTWSTSTLGAYCIGTILHFIHFLKFHLSCYGHAELKSSVCEIPVHLCLCENIILPPAPQWPSCTHQK